MKRATVTLFACGLLAAVPPVAGAAMAAGRGVAATAASAAIVAHPAAAALHARAGCTGCPAPAPCPTCWHPPLVSRWQYQLQGAASYASTGGINTTISAVPYTGGSPVSPVVFDIDLYVDQAISGGNSTVDTAAVNDLHARGDHVICYVDAGTWEIWRPDAGSFPASVLGRNNGWPGEKWLDIRQTSILLPLMDARVAKCKTGGFDAVEFDNVDGAFNNTGFPLSTNDQLVYNSSLANLAHQRGLSVGLKNDVDANQVSVLLPYFDFAVNEQCFQYGECSVIHPFVAAGKPIFNVEYKRQPSQFCPSANSSGNNINGIKKNLNLYDVPWTPCR